MRDRRRLAARVISIVKRNDKKVLVQRAFYDDASDRVFVTLVKGAQRVNLTLRARELESDDLASAEKLIKDNIAQIAHVPIG